MRRMMLIEGVVAVEQARRGDEADLVPRLVGEALRFGQVGHRARSGCAAAYLTFT
jgi:hypothetical protein